MAKVSDYINKIRNAVYGKEVRGAISNGIDAINKEVESTTQKQEHLETTFDDLVINAGESNAEIVDARVDKNSNTSYKKLGDRLDNVSSQILNLEESFELQSSEIKKNKLNSEKTENSLSFSIVSQKEEEFIYEFKPLILDVGISNYYPNGLSAAEVALNHKGILSFKGAIKVDDSAPNGEFITIAHLPSEFKYENLTDETWRHGLAIGENDSGKMKTIPIGLRSINGKGVLQIYKNGEDELYTKCIYLNTVSIQTQHYDICNIYNHLKEKTNIIIGRQSYCEFQFPFLPDYHWDIFDTRASLTINYLNKIDSIVDFNCYLSGGDNTVEPILTNENCGKRPALLAHKHFNSKIPKDKLIWCKGNHDDNSLTDDISKYLYPSDIKPTINNSKIIWAGDDLYYGYFDDELAKIRIIIVDSFEHDYSTNEISVPRNISATQIDWLCENALNFMNKINRDKWHVVFISHYPPLQDSDNVLEFEGPLRNSAAMEIVLDSFKNAKQCAVIDKVHRFDLQGNMNIIAWFYGHFHLDQHQIKNGVNFISSVASYNKGYKETRIKGTISELAVDIISIDKVNREIYLDRVGSGTNRKFSY